MIQKRKDPVEGKKYNTAQLEMYITKQGNLASIILKYQFEISQGPTCVCSCCGSLHFRKSVVVLKWEKNFNPNQTLLIRFACTTQLIQSICVRTVTCTSKEGRIPKIALCHGLAFPKIPTQLLGA